MECYINGIKKDIQDNITLYDLLSSINVSEGIAASINNKLVIKAEWKTQYIQSNDRIEILTPIQGG